jgi:hypothetical protein
MSDACQVAGKDSGDIDTAGEEFTDPKNRD